MQRRESEREKEREREKGTYGSVVGKIRTNGARLFSVRSPPLTVDLRMMDVC